MNHCFSIICILVLRVCNLERPWLSLLHTSYFFLCVNSMLPIILCVNTLEQKQTTHKLGTLDATASFCMTFHYKAVLCPNLIAKVISPVVREGSLLSFFTNYFIFTTYLFSLCRSGILKLCTSKFSMCFEF